MNENRGMKNMDQTSNNQNESDEIKMSRGSVDANEGSLGSGKKKSRFGIGVLVGIVIGAVIITGVWGAAKVVSAVFFKGNFGELAVHRFRPRCYTHKRLANRPCEFVHKQLLQAFG